MTAGWFEGDSDPAEPEGRVTVARFSNPVEAQIARGMLESAGIECFLAGENVNNLLQSAFRVRMQVSAEDRPAALELLGSVEGSANPDDTARS
jgi:Putative prokaryotic signal transducing protein